MRRAERDDLLARLTARVDLEDRVRRALEVVTTDDEALRVVGAALDGGVPGRTALLVSDSDGHQLGHVDALASSGTLLDADSCVAFRRHTTTVTPSSHRFDACAHLRAAGEPVSGVCMPVAHGDQLFGVVQWQGPAGHPLHEVTVGALESVVHLLALRLALLRSSTGDDAPRTDPLTGMLNRRSTGLAVRNLVRDLVPFSLAMCNLDDFGAYNDHHGHEVGDRALRMFATTLSSTVRPDDIVGRTAGDVFVVAFPGTSAIDAAHALERVREVLVLNLSVGELPPFTVSFGVSDSNQGDSIDAIVETAELAVALAKRSGANRVVVAGEQTTHLPGDPET